mgnify:CR=1 FL=1
MDRYSTLGVGNNGHIAFNEPDEELSSGTHIITLTEEYY